MSMKAFFIGQREYKTVLALQQQLQDVKVHQLSALRKQRAAEVASGSDKKTSPSNVALLPDVTLLVEHSNPVYTMGRRDTSEGLPQINSIEVVRTRRGGGITFHGPGQLTAYPIANIQQLWSSCGTAKKARSPIQWFADCLNNSMIRTAATYGVPSREGKVGVWADAYEDTSARKLGFVGLQLSSWVSMHGLGLNVSNDLAYFDRIVMCEMPGKSATNLHMEMAARKVNMPLPTVADVAPVLFDHFIAELNSTQSVPSSETVVNLSAAPEGEWQKTVMAVMDSA